MTGYYTISETNKTKTETRVCGGTCFFIRKGGGLFLITAKHVFTGCEDGKKRMFWANDMVVFVGDSKSSKLLPIKLKIIRDTSCCNDTACIDQIAIKVENNKDIYSVENMMHPELQKMGSIITVGFPYTLVNGKNNLNEYIAPTRFYVPMGKYFLTINATGSKIDSFINENYNQVYAPPGDVDTSLHGYSGSPVFIESNKKWHLLGVFSFSKAGPPFQGTLGVVKIDKIINNINYLLRYMESN